MEDTELTPPPPANPTPTTTARGLRPNGETVQLLREAAGYSLDELATASECCRETLRRIELELNVTPPSIRIVNRIARALTERFAGLNLDRNVTVETLCGVVLVLPAAASTRAPVAA